MKSSEVLKKALELLSEEKNWTKGAFARDSLGEEVILIDQRATCFCAVGAIKIASQRFKAYEAVEALWQAAIKEKFRNIPEWNDHPNTKHSDVLEAFDLAIKVSEAKGD